MFNLYFDAYRLENRMGEITQAIDTSGGVGQKVKSVLSELMLSYVGILISKLHILHSFNVINANT